jgi:hypothetical protein
MVFASPESGEEMQVGTVTRDGFETSYKYTVPNEGIWRFRVVAFDKDLQPTGSSKIVTLLIGGKPVYIPLAAAQ